MMFKNLLFTLLVLLSAGMSTVQAQPGNPCDPNVVAQLTQDLIDDGFNCLVGAGPFACVDDVLNYAFDHCPPPVDTTFGNPCDSAHVNQLVAELIGGGFDCLEGAGPFLTEIERENLFAGGQWIVFEQALRFLTDFLAGDVYYKTSYATHNLVRAQNQLALLREIGRAEGAIRGFLG